MSEQHDPRAFEARTKAAFDADVGALDAATQSRLTQARVRALAELAPRRPWGLRSLLPVGAAAAAALAAWIALVPHAPNQPVQPAALGDLDVLTAAEDLQLIEELEFFAWLEAQPEFEAAADGDDI